MSICKLNLLLDPKNRRFRRSFLKETFYVSIQIGNRKKKKKNRLKFARSAAGQNGMRAALV